LDVGCANRPKGDVNVDLFIRKPNPHIENQLIEPSIIPNFVLADACHLPFSGKCFDQVFSSHLIEHVDDPYLLLRELIRVSSKVTEIYTPHRFYKMGNPIHKCHFTQTWFNKALKKIGCENFVTEIPTDLI